MKPARARKFAAAAAAAALALGLAGCGGFEGAAERGGELLASAENLHIQLSLEMEYELRSGDSPAVGYEFTVLSSMDTDGERSSGSVSLCSDSNFQAYTVYFVYSGGTLYRSDDGRASWTAEEPPRGEGEAGSAAAMLGVYLEKAEGLSEAGADASVQGAACTRYDGLLPAAALGYGSEDAAPVSFWFEEESGRLAAVEAELAGLIGGELLAVVEGGDPMYGGMSVKSVTLRADLWGYGASEPDEPPQM